MSKKIVIFNVFGHLNAGDAMLLEALYDILTEYHPDEEIVGIAFDVESERNWMPQIRWCERIGTKTRAGIVGKIVQLARVGIVAAISISRIFLPLRRFLPVDQRAAIEALRTADLAISCPGGYLEDSNNAYLLNLLQMLLARRLARQVILAPQSVGPVRSRIGRFAMGIALQRMKAIYVREPRSWEFVRKNFPRIIHKVHESGDLAFWYNRRRNENIDSEWMRLGVEPGKPIIGMTVIGWKWAPPTTR